jgi:hypothetical protein
MLSSRVARHFHFRKTALDLPDAVNPAFAGHIDVHQDDIRLKGCGIFHGIQAMTEFAGQLEFIRLPDDRGQHITQACVVFIEGDFDHCSYCNPYTKERRFRVFPEKDRSHDDMRYDL